MTILAPPPDESDEVLLLPDDEELEEPVAEADGDAELVMVALAEMDAVSAEELSVGAAAARPRRAAMETSFKDVYMLE